MKSTIEDVAMLAGVSIATVSRVINNNYPVKKETREKVNSAIKQLSYRPNPLAQGLINKRSRTIGIVVPSITNMYFTEVVQGIEKHVRTLGYDILLSDSGGEAKDEVKCVKKLADRLADGIIIVDPQFDNIKENIYDSLSNELPLICINGYYDKTQLNFVLSDEEKGTSDALEYLFNLGHKKIAFVRGGKSRSYDIKQKIYSRYMKKMNYTEMIVDVGHGNSIDVVNNAARTVTQINASTYQLGKDITAIFACNDLMAVGIMNGCMEMNLSIPRDISIIGFDNIILSEMTNVKLTTVDQNMGRLGELAAEKIIELIDGNELHFHNAVIDTKLIERDSCSIPVA